MKVKAILLTLAVSATLFAGCAKSTPAPAASPSPKATTSPAATASPKADAVTTASVVDNNAAFEKALTKEGGKYVIAILKDLTFTKELVVEGDFKTGKKDDKGNIIKDAEGNDATQRKIALYTQDDKKNVTARFTLTAPKMTFKSNYGSIEHGTFKGDLYISGKNFKLVDATIDGNVYFTTDDAKSTFKMDDKSKITGKQELKK